MIFLSRYFLPFLFIFGFHVFASAQLQYFKLLPDRKNETVQFSNYDNLIVTEFVINDTLPVRLMLDSGVEGVIITDKAVSLRLKDIWLRDFKISAPGSSRELDASITKRVKLGFEPLQPIFTNMVLLKDDYFSLDQYMGTRVHGLIGMENFKDLMVTISYDRNTLRFERPEAFKIKNKTQIIPVVITRGKPYIPVRIALDNVHIKDLWLLIDSGANHPLLLENDSLDGFVPGESLNAVIGKGLAGVIPGSFARVGWLMLGNFRLDDIVTSFTDEYMPGNFFNRQKRHGTLGAGALARFVVTFDYTNSRILLRKGQKFKQPFEYNMSGLNFRSFGAGFNIFEVSEVISGSPGDEAGIKPGDILMSVDEKYTFMLNMGELNNLLSDRPGKTVKLGITRNGKRMNFKIKLRRLI
ncbi:MAG: PDZ domain-containing protein [Lentimicrobiaceae bacterium]|nr:PDZ domain-containing protein [Lentimicrobiaceae bacterium]